GGPMVANSRTTPPREARLPALEYRASLVEECQDAFDVLLGGRRLILDFGLSIQSFGQRKVRGLLQEAPGEPEGDGGKPRQTVGQTAGLVHERFLRHHAVDQPDPESAQR